MGIPPISIIGFGLVAVSSEILDPSPPAKITAFMLASFKLMLTQASLDNHFPNVPTPKTTPLNTPKTTPLNTPDISIQSSVINNSY